MKHLPISTDCSVMLRFQAELKPRERLRAVNEGPPNSKLMSPITGKSLFLKTLVANTRSSIQTLVPSIRLVYPPAFVVSEEAIVTSFNCLKHVTVLSVILETWADGKLRNAQTVGSLNLGQRSCLLGQELLNVAVNLEFK